jgi:chromosome segregation ATPase
MSSLVIQIRAECESTIQDSTRKNSDLQQQNAQLRTSIHDSQLESGQAQKLIADMEARYIERIRSLKTEYNERCDRHVTILAAIQTVVHELAANANELHVFFSFLRNQQTNLADVLSQLRHRRKHDRVERELEYEESEGNESGMFTSPLRAYGADVSAVIHALANKCIELRDTNSSLQAEVMDQQQLVKTLQHRQTILENQVNDCAQQVVDKHKQLQQFQNRDRQSSQEQVRTQQQDIAALQTSIHTLKREHEAQVADLTHKQLTAQSEVAQLHSELMYVRSSFDSRLEAELKNLQERDKTISEMKQAHKSFEQSISQLKQEIIDLEAEVNRQSAQSRQIKQEAGVLVQKAIAEKKKHLGREAALLESNEKYEKQMADMQKLLSVVQEHRHALMTQGTSNSVESQSASSSTLNSGSHGTTMASTRGSEGVVGDHLLKLRSMKASLNSAEPLIKQPGHGNAFLSQLAASSAIDRELRYLDRHRPTMPSFHLSSPSKGVEGAGGRRFSSPSQPFYRSLDDVSPSAKARLYSSPVASGIYRK